MSEAAQLGAFAQLSQNEPLLVKAERVANELLDRTGSMSVGQVRKVLGERGVLKNDGTEVLDGLGALGRRMHLVACGVEREPEEITVSHRNRGTVWRRPDGRA